MPADQHNDLALLPWLLPAAARPHLLCLLHFAAAARRLVDAPCGDASERLTRLRALDPVRHPHAPAEIVIPGDAPADGAPADEAIRAAGVLARSIAATGVPGQHVRHLLQACEREASGWSAETWSDLLVHGRFAAASIGRHALAVLGEDAARAGPATDALCIAAWILEGLHRIDAEAAGGQGPRCIPARFFSDAMISAGHLRIASARGQIRAVLDRVLDGVDHLLAQAAPLPDVVADGGTRRHARVLLCRATALAGRIRDRDPLAAAVHLAAWQRWRCLVLGVLPRLRRSRPH